MSEKRTISEFQQLMRDLYLERDTLRGPEKTMLWLVSEVGELAEGIKDSNIGLLKEEMADVLAWLCSLANIYHIDLLAAAWEKYPNNCSVCHQKPCTCVFR